MRPGLLASAILFAAAAGSTAFADTIVTYTYNTAVRPISGLVDEAGLFGVPGADLSGLPAVVVYTVDVSKGILLPGSAMATYLYVPETSDLSSLNVSASITINGHTFHSAPSTDTVGTSGYGETIVGGIVQDQSFEVQTADGPSLYSGSHIDSSTFVFDYFGNQIVLVPQFEYVLDAANGNPQLSTDVLTYVVTPTVTVTTTPEPSSIVLCGIGLVIISTVFRRRSQAILA